MSKEPLMLDVGQANEIKLAARRAGATNADLKSLTEGDMFARILPVLRGEAAVRNYPIDLNAKPFVPEGWEIVEHHQQGVIEWDPAKVRLHHVKGQENAEELLANLKEGLVVGFNANFLDYLLKHSHLIPEAWTMEPVYFPGTVYRDREGALCLRCLMSVDPMSFRKSPHWESSNGWLHDLMAPVLIPAGN